MSESPMQRMKPPMLPEVEIPILSPEQVQALLAACKGNGFEERRDYAIVMTFLDAGLRLAELTGLRIEEDVDLKMRTLSVLGKGRKYRNVGLGGTGDAGARPIHPRSPLPPAGPPARAMDRQEGLAHDERDSPDARASRGDRRHRWTPPAHAPPLVRPHLVSQRWRGDRSDASGGMEFTSDGRPVRGVHCRRAGPGSASSSIAWGPALTAA